MGNSDRWLRMSFYQPCFEQGLQVCPFKHLPWHDLTTSQGWGCEWHSTPARPPHYHCSPACIVTSVSRSEINLTGESIAGINYSHTKIPIRKQHSYANRTTPVQPWNDRLAWLCTVWWAQMGVLARRRTISHIAGLEHSSQKFHVWKISMFTAFCWQKHFCLPIWGCYTSIFRLLETRIEVKDQV